MKDHKSHWTPKHLFFLVVIMWFSESAIPTKVGTHEGTSRRDLFQGLVRCRVYTMGQVAGTSPLKGLHAGTCYTSKQQNLGRFH